MNVTVTRVSMEVYASMKTTPSSAHVRLDILEQTVKEVSHFLLLKRLGNLLNRFCFLSFHKSLFKSVTQRHLFYIVVQIYTLMD